MMVACGNPATLSTVPSFRDCTLAVIGTVVVPRSSTVLVTVDVTNFVMAESPIEDVVVATGMVRCAVVLEAA